MLAFPHAQAPLTLSFSHAVDAALIAITASAQQVVPPVPPASISIQEVALILVPVELNRILQLTLAMPAQSSGVRSAQTMPRYAPNATQGYR